jgi:hypothetical protein
MIASTAHAKANMILSDINISSFDDKAESWVSPNPLVRSLS